MRYLITGGAGFVGSHLADRLVERGDEVLLLDDLSAGSRDNVARAVSGGRAELIEGSVTDEALVRELLSEVDGCFHLASAVGVRLIFESPVDTLLSNIRGMEVVISAAADASVRLLLASSSEIYGKSDMPLREDGDRVLGPPTHPRWTYANAKSCGEMLAYGYVRSRDARNTVARLFNTIGPRQTGRYGMVVPRFISQARAGEPLTVYGDGSQLRCFTHVHDAVGALLLLIESEQAIGRPFNVGSQSELSIEELAELVLLEVGSNSPIHHVPYEVAFGADFDDLSRRRPDTTRIAETTGWRAELGPEVAIADILEYERARAGSPTPSA